MRKPVWEKMSAGRDLGDRNLLAEWRITLILDTNLVMYNAPHLEGLDVKYPGS